MIGVLGLDLSVTASGVALPNGRLKTVKPYFGPEHPGRRWDELDGHFEQIVRYLHPRIAVVEGIGLHGYPLSLVAMGGIHAIVLRRLFRASVEVFVAAPTQLKQWATGKGTATKEEMVAAAVAAGADPEDDNQADAFFLRQMGLAAVERGVLADHQAAVLDRLDWRLG